MPSLILRNHAKIKAGWDNIPQRIMKHITPDKFIEMPWKNGAGTTFEILRLPQQGDFNLRVSMAKVDSDGPFSSFPGVSRILKILSGHGVELALKDSSLILDTKSAPFVFSGEETVQCRLLKDPVTDFNVMFRKDFGRAILDEKRINVPMEIKCAKDLLLIFETESKNFWMLQKEEVLELRPGHFFFIDVTILQ